ncbi:hypothetical protein WH47_03697, partial [Habropoda laboriosa]
TRGLKRKLSDENKDTPKKEDCEVNEQIVTENLECESNTFKDDSFQNKDITSETGGMKCIGILPGLGSYEDSSDSDCSSDTDQDPEPNHSKYDLLGRKIIMLKDKEKS